MLNNVLERPEAQDTGSIILTGFEPEIVLSSVRTAIEQHSSHADHSSLITDYSITNTSWRVLKLILGNAGLSNKPVRRRRMVGNRIEHRCMLHTLIEQICTDFFEYIISVKTRLPATAG